MIVKEWDSTSCSGDPDMVEGLSSSDCFSTADFGASGSDVEAFTFTCGSTFTGEMWYSSSCSGEADYSYDGVTGSCVTEDSDGISMWVTCDSYLNMPSMLLALAFLAFLL